MIGYFGLLESEMCILFSFRLAEIVERETEAWYKMDPDPFDDRHPGDWKFLSCHLHL